MQAPRQSISEFCPTGSETLFSATQLARIQLGVLSWRHGYGSILSTQSEIRRNISFFLCKGTLLNKMLFLVTHLLFHPLDGIRNRRCLIVAALQKLTHWFLNSTTLTGSGEIDRERESWKSARDYITLECDDSGDDWIVIWFLTMFALELESPSQPLIFIGGRVCEAAQHEAAREREKHVITTECNE